MLRWFKKLFSTIIPGPNRLRFESAGGYKFYSDRDRLHNEHHPTVITPDGLKLWYLNNKLARRDGPSIESPDGSKYWTDGVILHRLDGPAIEHANGSKIFYLQDRELTFEQWMKHTTASTAKKVELSLIYS